MHDLLTGINRRQARLMVTLVLIAVPIGFLNELSSIAALALVRGTDFLSIFEKTQREALPLLFLNLHFQGLVGKDLLLTKYSSVCGSFLSPCWCTGRNSCRGSWGSAWSWMASLG